MNHLVTGRQRRSIQSILQNTFAIMQVISHGRHPAEWDRVNCTWFDDSAPATPHFSCLDAPCKPDRAREVVCELLAYGFPVARDAHVKQLNNALVRKTFVKRTRRLLAVVRVPSTASVHAMVAAAQAVLAPDHAEFIGAAQAAIYAAPVVGRSAALAEVVCTHRSSCSIVCAFAGVRECGGIHGAPSNAERFAASSACRQS